MTPGINIEEVKKYNASLKEFQAKSSQMRAAIEFNTKELDRLCKELSTELGITVTPENIEAIREERIAKIQNTLKVGTEILNRIKQEEESVENIQSGITQAQVVQQTTAPITQPGMQPMNIGETAQQIEQKFQSQEQGQVTPQMAPPPVAPNMGDSDDIFAAGAGIPPIFGSN